MIRAQKLKQEILNVLKSKGVEGESTETLIESIAVGLKRHLEYSSDSRLSYLLKYFSLLNEMPEIYRKDEIYKALNDAIIKELGLFPFQNIENH